MDNPIEIDLEKVIEHIHAEDGEEQMVQDIIDNAQGYVNKYIYSNGVSIQDIANDEDYKNIYIRIILMIASSWYSTADGAEPASVAANSKVMSGLKMLMETIRTPNIGGWL